MKRLIKKNQVIVAALALMIAAAGYLNYSGKLFESTDDSGVSQQANSELLDISEEDIETGSGDIEARIRTRPRKRTGMWKAPRERLC